MLMLPVSGSGFLSTPSARRATDFHALSFSLNGISIHALREEGDLVPQWLNKTYDLFLSTPSARRATNGVEMRKIKIKIFLSTPSARRATTQQRSR